MAIVSSESRSELATPSLSKSSTSSPLASSSSACRRLIVTISPFVSYVPAAVMAICQEHATLDFHRKAAISFLFSGCRAFRAKREMVHPRPKARIHNDGVFAQKVDHRKPGAPQVLRVGGGAAAVSSTQRSPLSQVDGSAVNCGSSSLRLAAKSAAAPMIVSAG